MMGPDTQDVEVVEDDMGEGYTDPIEAEENFRDKLQRDRWKMEERIRRNFKAF